MTSAELRRAVLMAAAVVGLHVLGGVLLLASGGIVGLGVGATAYTLGMRHAFDADHISAIDNTTRKLMAQGQRPLSVGFFFSLGHSTIVFLLALLFSVGVRGLSGSVVHDGSALHRVTEVIGPGVSGTLLLVIAAVNMLILVNIVSTFLGTRGRSYDERELERELDRRGLLNRIYGRAALTVDKPWHMYPIGVLFGLGFDTASEVALLFLAAGAAGAGLPFYAILCLPVLFAAGMTLLDTIDGAFMNFAYGWALSQPVRKTYYNITITGLSVAVALIVGMAELLPVLANGLGLRGGVWDGVSNLDLNIVGYVIVGLFVLTWGISMAVWRYGRIEERWSARLARGSAARP